MMNTVTAMPPSSLYGLAPTLITLQFAAFGWRMNRQINHGELQGSKWLPIPDILNILSLFASVTCLIVLPIVTTDYVWLSRIAAGVGYVLIAFHPFSVSAHYCLWTGGQRDKTASRSAKAFSYASGEELVLVSLSLLFATMAGVYIGSH